MNLAQTVEQLCLFYPTYIFYPEINDPVVTAQQCRPTTETPYPPWASGACSYSNHDPKSVSNSTQVLK